MTLKPAAVGGLDLLVTDTNVLVSELLRSRGRRWLARPGPLLVVTERVDGEVRYELSRRLQALGGRGTLAPELLTRLHAEALLLYREKVTVIPAEPYITLEALARARVPGDPDDWPTAALGLLLGAALWTEDRDFFGCGLSVWRTDVLYQVTADHPG
ncbi:PIN domain-containing protein [Deinococcus reticulitermitis]|uniref:PIN domain-containing protein n=1 Tax=Deinococcus reticulitermitis TaxID=856736 RepID=A0A1H7BPH3_9DEIO|nr:PIN domain-containing protein [Deinococcus reticulitermitis]SEJ79368.1 PIN domain-containing protein [Deinococcus reticulitermitis]